MSAAIIDNGHAPAETLPAVIPQQPPPAPALLGADELDQVLEVAQMVAEGADRLHLESLATRIRAQAMRAVQQMEEMRRLAADPAVRMWKVDEARTKAVDAAREVASLVRAYRKRQQQAAERAAKRAARTTGAPSGILGTAAPGATWGRSQGIWRDGWQNWKGRMSTFRCGGLPNSRGSA